MNQEKYWEEYIKAYEKIMDITVLINEFLYPGYYKYKRITSDMSFEEKKKHIANDMESQEFSALVNYDLFESLEYYYPETVFYNEDPTDKYDLLKSCISILEKTHIDLQNRILPFVKSMTITDYGYKHPKQTTGLNNEQIWALITKDDPIINMIGHEIDTIITTMLLDNNEESLKELLKEYYQLDDLEYKRSIENKKCSIVQNIQSDTNKIKCDFNTYPTYFEDIYGQDIAIKQIEKALKRSILFHNAESVRAPQTQRKSPLCTFMFYGPTGTGKTEAAKLIAKFVFEDDKKLLILDMNSYKDGKIGASAIKGHPEGYVNSESGTDFTRFLKKNPQGVIVLDEFEKAAPEAREIFMTMIDEGEFKDALGNVYDLTSYIFIATTNASEKSYRKTNVIGFATDTREKQLSKEERDIREELREVFTSPIMNRFNNLVHFKKIEYDDAMAICNNVIRKLIYKFESKRFDGVIPKIKIVDNDAVCKLILKECEYQKDGVRSLKNVINDRIGNEIIEQIISKNYDVCVSVKDNQIDVSKTFKMVRR